MFARRRRVKLRDCLLRIFHQKFDPPTVATIPHSVFLKSLTDVVRSIPRSSRMRRLIATFLTLAAVFLAATPADAGVRLALVIGNGKYVNAPALGNPANDSADLARALRGVGFEVIEQQDASREAMTRALREFSARLRGTEVALFFYAGHGIQLNGENYLLPVDADIQSPADVRFNTVDLTDIQQEMEGSGRVNIIILDACRNNPFADRLTQSGRAAPSRGLGRIDATGEGSLIVYSTQPNNVALDGAGRNSPFTAALLKHVITPGIEVRQMLSRVRGDVLAATERRQTPWDSSSLTGDIYLAGAPVAQALAATPAAIAPPPGKSEAADNSRTNGQLAAMTGAPPAALTAAPKPDAPPQNECDRLIAFAPPFATPEQLKRAKHVNWPAAAAACAAVVAERPNDMRMQYYYGLALDKTNNVVEALRRVKMAADSGDTDAMVTLGVDFATGHGVLKNPERAFELFSKSAAAGNPEAVSDLGSMYSNGIFVKQDFAKALDYYEKAIEGGSSFSLNQLGVMYFAGKGVERDYHAAAEYFKQAADLDDGYALKSLAIMNERGLLGGKNLEQAGALRARAQQVDPDSQNPDLGSPATPVRHVASGRSHTIVIRRYRFIGCSWAWC
jgi:TPR repeat protein